MKIVMAHRDYQILGGILFLALLLRVWGLNEPLWYDEILTLETHVRLAWGDMMQAYSMNHHYLFSLQAKAFVELFGESAWALRMPAMLFGVASIGVIWWLARDMAGRAMAHITALLLALSYHHIWFSQNARGYTELAFWSALGMALFLRGLDKPSAKVWLGYGACLALAVATHLTGLFFFMAQGLVWLFVALRAFPSNGVRAPIILWPALGFAFGGLLTLLFYLPIFPSLLETMGGVGASSSSDVMSEYQNPIWSLLEGVRTAIGSLGPLVGLVAFAVLVIVGLGAWSIWDKKKVYPISIFLHIMVTLAILLVLNMRIWPRFFFIDIGFLMLLIVLGVRYSTELFSRFIALIQPETLFRISVAAMLLISVGMASRNYMAPKQNLEGAYTFIQEEVAGDARIYAVGVASTVFNGFYDAGWGEVFDGDQFAEATAQPGELYLVVAFPSRSFRTLPEMDKLVEDEILELVKAFPGTLGDGAVLIYRRG